MRLEMPSEHGPAPGEEDRLRLVAGRATRKAQALISYWRDRYDSSRFERQINKVPQLRTTTDGLGIHFIHVRSKHPNALPIIMTHGWPGEPAREPHCRGEARDPGHPALHGRRPWLFPRAGHPARTIGYALAGSPVGQAPWIYEKFHAWTDNNGNQKMR
jgi:hypothetical protein